MANSLMVRSNRSPFLYKKRTRISSLIFSTSRPMSSASLTICPKLSEISYLVILGQICVKVLSKGSKSSNTTFCKSLTATHQIEASKIEKDKALKNILAPKMSLLIYKDLQRCSFFRLLSYAFDLIFALSSPMDVLDLSERAETLIRGNFEKSHWFPFFVKQDFLIRPQKPILKVGTWRGQIRLIQRYCFSSVFMTSVWF